jgi:hypothetical protein
MEQGRASPVTSNWRGEPLVNCETIVNLIAKTTTVKGLKVKCRLDRRKYPTGRKISSLGFGADRIGSTQGFTLRLAIHIQIPPYSIG